ncbi:YbjN domain-containing protein [uncultured Nocardioides sp.]|uniref:TY-Chap domain-containing protein n=1 Tax=uncultured Nocardioides sp. TaxID=198441 RepID=UPI00262D37D4|nr:YbjN domain-containing protein [uncultured Nocardioides sp.]
MSEELGRRWDDAVETAWREFRQRLADHVAAMVADDSLVVEVPQAHESGAAPYCQVAGGDEMVRVEAVSNVYLAVECELDGEREALLDRIGFQRPEADDWSEGETNFWADLEQREADRAAVMVVRALREVYGVLHPVYLDAGGLEPEGAVRPLPPKPHRVEPDLDEAVQPSTIDEVRGVIDLAVADLYDDAPEWDDDGDLPLPTEDRLVWVTVHKDAPRVLLSCLLVDDVADEQAALAEVNRLNRAEFGLTFFLTEQRISVTRELGLGVAVPAAVRGEVNRLLSQVDGWAHDLGERVRTAPEPPGERAGSRFETAYAVMAELEREERGSVGPAAMMRIYGNDTGLLLKAIRITEKRRREVRTRAREAQVQGQRTREKAARARHDYLRDLTQRMRAGLRLMVDAPVRKVQLDQLALFDEDEAGTGR